MVDEIEKLLKKVKRQDRKRLLSVFEAIERGDTAGLHIAKLKGSSLYKIRVGNFRITLSFNQSTNQFEVESVQLRNESTYK